MNNQETFEQFVAHLQKINRHIRNSRSDLDIKRITRVQWLLLRRLKREDCTIGQLAEYLNVRSSTMSQMIDRLEKANLVIRENTAADARVKHVQLTKEGEQLIRQSEEHWIRELSGPFEHFTDEERALLTTLMEKLVMHLPNKER